MDDVEIQYMEPCNAIQYDAGDARITVDSAGFDIGMSEVVNVREFLENCEWRTNAQCHLLSTQK